MIERVEITNFERWGKLVKTWATGTNRLGDGNDYPIPTSLEQFKQQLTAAQVGATIPERVKAVQFVQANGETLLIRLPPKEGVENSERELEAGGNYLLPPFYRRIFGGADPVVADGDKLKFHAERIGDYTISNCM